MIFKLAPALIICRLVVSVCLGQQPVPVPEHAKTASESKEKEALGFHPTFDIVLPDQITHTQELPSFHTAVKVVNLLVTVRNRHGNLIQDLTRGEFKLTEDGRPQTIRYFAKQTDIPLTIALLVDTSMSQERVLPEERQAASDFLNTF